MNERIEATVSGRVQMVMFRDFVQRNASKLKLTGEVKNRSNGTVAVVAEGPHATLERLVEKLHEGPLLSHVEHVAVDWLPANGSYKKFKISYD